MKTALFRFLEKCEPIPIAGCWIWTASHNKVYGKFYLNGRLVGAHRASLMLHGVRVKDKDVVCHRCDMPLCVNPAHLMVGTSGSNIQDAISKGRVRYPNRKGELNNRAKLTEPDVLLIRNEPGTLQRIGAKYGVSLNAVWRIKNKLSWSHL